MNKPFYIFLDFDGVVISGCSLMHCQNRNNYEDKFSQFALNMLTYFQESNPDVKFVLSCCDRNNPECTEILTKHGINVIGKTPYIKQARGYEIRDYMKENNISDDEICILDDGFNTFPETNLMYKLIKTEFKTGLQPEHILELQRLYEHRDYSPSNEIYLECTLDAPDESICLQCGNCPEYVFRKTYSKQNADTLLNMRAVLNFEKMTGGALFE